MTFIPVLTHKRRVFETEIIFLSGLGAEIAILVFASCWSTVGGVGGGVVGVCDLNLLRYNFHLAV